MLILACLYLFKGCGSTQTPTQKAIHDTIVVNKHRVDSIEKVVYRDKIIVKQVEIKRDKIHYKTHFDSTATIDTVKVELAKADTSNVLADTIIDKLTVIISNDSKVISDNEELSKADKKEIRRQKRKKITAALGSGLAIAGTGIAIFSNPFTGIAVTVCGAIVTISALRK